MLLSKHLAIFSYGYTLTKFQSFSYPIGIILGRTTSTYSLNKFGNPNRKIAESKNSKSKNARNVSSRWKLLFISGDVNTTIDIMFPEK